ncbi:hypothetical protein ACFPRL_29640 [Pseudoclavibacter helvolus]
MCAASLTASESNANCGTGPQSRHTPVRRRHQHLRRSRGSPLPLQPPSAGE